MRVIICEKTGPPEVLKLTERPIPEPGADQALVAVDYAAITYVETQVRRGIVPPPGGPGAAFPRVLGNGVTGKVVRVGENVDPTWVGKSVVTATGGSGGYAEYAAAPARLLHAVPEGLDPKVAVALLADGRTAMALVRAARIRPGEGVLVTAAAGGLGSLLVQLARARGAGAVIGLAGGPRKVELVRSLGAGAAVDYRAPGWEQEVWRATGGNGVDVAFDGVGGAMSKAIVSLVRKGGRYLPHGFASGEEGDLSPEMTAALEVVPMRSIIAGPEDEYDLVEQALKAAALGNLAPVIGQIYPLERAAEAHAAIEARQTVGKTLLAVEARAGWAP